MGHVAAKLLLQCIADPHHVSRKVLLPTEIVIRASCAPPRTPQKSSPRHAAKHSQRKEAPDTKLSNYSVAADLPEIVPITELEPRALEVLLGGDLKKLLAETPEKALKSRTK